MAQKDSDKEDLETLLRLHAELEETVAILWDDRFGK